MNKIKIACILIMTIISILFVLFFVYNIKQNIPESPIIHSFQLEKIRDSEIDGILTCQDSSVDNINSLIAFVALKAPTNWSRISLFVDYVPVYRIEINNDGSFIEIYEEWVMIMFEGNNQKIPVSRSLNKKDIIKALKIVCEN